MHRQGGKTVIIVGAGCSAEFGLPTGYSIMSSLRSEPLGLRTFGISSYNLFSEPFSKVVCNFNQSPAYGRESVAKFLSSAKESYADSIDLFAFNHESYSALCKAYSTWKILGSIYNTNTHIDGFGDAFTEVELTRRWQQPVIDDRPNWIAAIARKYTENKNNLGQLDPNSLTIVTFNYDTIIEDALQFFFERSERFSQMPRALAPQVHHIYGNFPDLPARFTNAETLNSCASSIRYINDVNHPTPNAVQKAIKEASRIYIVGFDMEPKNVELIGLDQTNARICALNYDGNYRLNSRFKSIGVEDALLVSGTAKQPMSIGEACRQGFFDLANY